MIRDEDRHLLVQRLADLLGGEATVVEGRLKQRGRLSEDGLLGAGASGLAFTWAEFGRGVESQCWRWAEVEEALMVDSFLGRELAIRWPGGEASFAAAAADGMAALEAALAGSGGVQANADPGGSGAACRQSEPEEGPSEADVASLMVSLSLASGERASEDRSEAASPGSRCPSCGTEGNPDFRFCLGCGAELGGSAGAALDAEDERPRLLVVRGPEKGRSFSLDASSEAVIGRASVDVCLPSAALSRRHARVSVERGAWTLEDLGSPGGTRLNGEAIDAPALLRNGDLIELAGECELLFADGYGSPAGRPLPPTGLPAAARGAQARFAVALAAAVAAVAAALGVLIAFSAR